jgi:hypothetical protein
MTVETVLVILVGAAFACYLVFRWQEAAVDMAVPPYQPPVKSVGCNGDCNQGRDCVCFQQSCDMSVQEFDTKLNPQATWPFPHGDKP